MKYLPLEYLNPPAAPLHHPGSNYFSFTKLGRRDVWHMTHSIQAQDTDGVGIAWMMTVGIEAEMMVLTGVLVITSE